jgi:hypothetical protein
MDICLLVMIDSDLKRFGTPCVSTIAESPAGAESFRIVALRTSTGAAPGEGNRALCAFM